MKIGQYVTLRIFCIKVIGYYLKKTIMFRKTTATIIKMKVVIINE